MNNIWMIDDFLDDPVAERERALVASYETHGRNGFSYPGISICKDKDSVRKIERLIETKFRKNIAMYRRYIQPDDDKQETYIHTDVLIGTFTCILFLNTPEQCNGGTAFWRHKETGLDAAINLMDRENGFWDRMYEDGFDEDKWEQTHLVEMKFNRMLIFWSPLFHSRYPRFGFGSDTQTSRLLKIFFCKAA